MNIGQMYVLLCVVLAVLTIATFWFAGLWWGVGVGVASVAIAIALFLLGFHVQRRIDEQFKSY